MYKGLFCCRLKCDFTMKKIFGYSITLWCKIIYKIKIGQDNVVERYQWTL